MAYTKTLVSRNALSLIRFFAVEDESCRERSPQFAQTCQSALSALIAAHLEGRALRHSNLDLIALFQLERVDHRCGQTHRQAISPLRDLYGSLLGYTLHIVYPTLRFSNPASASEDPVNRWPHDNRNCSANHAKTVAPQQSDQRHYDRRPYHVKQSRSPAGNGE